MQKTLIPSLLPAAEVFPLEYLTWFAEFQFCYAWLWRKAREPGGLSHPSAKPFHEIPERDRVFIRQLAPGILDYLRHYGKKVILHLVEVGKLLHEVGANLEEGEFVDPLRGVPLLNGEIAQIETSILNALAFSHHELWMHTRDWTKLLPDKSLHAPIRKEHEHWDRSKPDKRWDRDRGNIYGIAFTLAIMPNDRLKVLIDASAE